jgi:hypothetical protein
MNNVTRRDALRVVGATGAAALAATAAAAADPQAKKPKHNIEPPVDSKATPENCGPREMFAVVDQDGSLKRGMHAVAAKRLDLGVYEVIFSRDVRRGVYLVTPGGAGYAGVPLTAAASVMGRASNPRGVLVYTTDLAGNQLATGFHLLVVCPDGFA